MTKTTKTSQKPVPKVRRRTANCPHCGAECVVWRNGNRCCPMCGEPFRVDCFDIPPVKQPDDFSCGWATTLWLLRSFGEIGNGAVAEQKLREELNTDAKRGARGLVNRAADAMNTLIGLSIPRTSGTMPLAIFSALSRRGLTLKNPIRAESPMAFVDYLDDTFREGGRAVMLLWRLDGFMHWMGVVKKGGQIRVMDPNFGAYYPLDTALANYNTKNHAVNFLVVGIIQKKQGERHP